MSMQSSKLTQFYRAYQAWLDAGAPQHQPFYREVGLCENLGKYLHYSEPDILDEMLEQFRKRLKKIKYPFNKNGEDYMAEACGLKSYLNKKRLEWVKEHTQ